MDLIINDPVALDQEISMVSLNLRAANNKALGGQSGQKLCGKSVRSVGNAESLDIIGAGGGN
jgi:hypothetical protein